MSWEALMNSRHFRHIPRCRLGPGEGDALQCQAELGSGYSSALCSSEIHWLFSKYFMSDVDMSAASLPFRRLAAGSRYFSQLHQNHKAEDNRGVPFNQELSLFLLETVSIFEKIIFPFDTSPPQKKCSQISVKQANLTPPPSN